MYFPNLGPLCYMPRPKMMRTLWALRGRLQYILVKGLQKNDDNEMKKKEPKGDEYIVSPCLRKNVENL